MAEKDKVAAERAERIRREAEKLLSPDTWEVFFLRTPCVKSSYLWGVGIGSLVFAHKLRLYPGKFRHAFNAAFLTFICTSSASFYICFSEVNRKYSTIQKAFKDQNIKEAKKKD